MQSLGDLEMTQGKPQTNEPGSGRFVTRFSNSRLRTLLIRQFLALETTPTRAASAVMLNQSAEGGHGFSLAPLMQSGTRDNHFIAFAASLSRTVVLMSDLRGESLNIDQSAFSIPQIVTNRRAAFDFNPVGRPC